MNSITDTSNVQTFVTQIKTKDLIVVGIARMFSIKQSYEFSFLEELQEKCPNLFELDGTLYAF